MRHSKLFIHVLIFAHFGDMKRKAQIPFSSLKWDTLHPRFKSQQQLRLFNSTAPSVQFVVI